MRDDVMRDVRAWGRALRRTVAIRRRLLAGACAAGAVAAAMDVLAPAPLELSTVLSAAHDIPAGTTLSATDIVALQLPRALVPDGALIPGVAVIGRPVSGPVRRGETLTDARLVGPTLLDGVGGGVETVAVPVRLGDDDAADFVQAGDRVDVLAAPLAAGDDSARPVEVVAVGALVLAVPADTEDTAGSLLIVAVPSATARGLARAATTARLSIALRGTS